jgi:poly(hydroxyalkanoate) granule-associated protein
MDSSNQQARWSQEQEMAKKTLKKKVQPKAAADKYVAPVMDSAREIWLAGLGAFAVAQQESGKLIEQGNKLFEKLVAEGSKLEKQTRSVAEDAVGGFRGEVESKVENVRQTAVDNWDKLENVFEDRVSRVLGRLGVPTADDVNKLSARVQKLSREVSRMSSKTTRAPAAKRAVKKPMARAKTAAAAKPAATA